MEDPIRSDEPVDRLTELCDAMTTYLDKLVEVEQRHDPTAPPVRAIVFLNTEEKGGIQIHGYEDPMEAMAELLLHLQQVFRAHGKDLQFMGLTAGDLS